MMSELGEMACGELDDVAAELALGALTGRERAQALAHLDACEACREAVLRLMMAAGELPALLPALDPPPGFEAAVMARIGLTAPCPLPRRSGRAVASFTRRCRGRLWWRKRRGVAL
jgi:anti-sigma-K factor RskA